MKNANLDINNDYKLSPDFFIIAENEVSLLLANSLINSDEDLQASNISKLFSIYKDTMVSLSNISENNLENIAHPHFSLKKSEGTKIKDEIFNIENGNHLVTFGMLTSRNYIENSTSKKYKKTEEADPHIQFLTDSISHKLTIKNLFNLILNSNRDSRELKHGIPILTAVDDSDFLSGTYPKSKYIKLLFDLNSDHSLVNKNSYFNGTINYKSSNTLYISCSQLFDSPKVCFLKIKEFLNKNNENNTQKDTSIESSYQNHIEKNTKKPKISSLQSLSPDLFKDPDFFISGPPRSGTSLLTVLLNNHDSVAIAQDTSVFTELRRATAWLDQIMNKNFKGNLNFDKYSNLSIEHASYIANKPLVLDSIEDSLLISCFFTCLMRFHSIDFFIPDPRKDRGTGIRYLNHINFKSAFHEIHQSKLSFKYLLNYCINSIIHGENVKGKLHGEKTPSHMLQSTFLRKLYPNAKFINLIRNPIGYIGSRQQRLNVPIKTHCDYFKKNIDNMIQDDDRTITIRYEDMINNPNITLNKIHDFLGITKTAINNSLDPGAYPKYVGKKIDKNRDKQNLDFLSDTIKSEIKYHLRDIFEQYYPELL